MKNVRYSILFVVCLLSLTACGACGKGQGNGEEEKNTAVWENKTRAPEGERGDPRWFQNGFPYDEEALSQRIDAFSNLKTGEDLFLYVPETCSLCRYTYSNPEDRNNRTYYEEFMGAYAYFFPDHPLNKDYLYYMAEDSSYDDEEGFQLVRDHLEEILEENYGTSHFIYDEAYKRQVDSREDLVGLELGNPVGYGYAMINKGEAAGLPDTVNDTISGSGVEPGDYNAISYYPDMAFETIGFYSPKSTRSFQLMDREVPINEAVAFYENYIEQLPFPAGANMKVKVIEVCVLRTGEDQYAYYFKTVGAYQGIPLDTVRDGATFYDMRGNYLTSGGYALMLRSDDVDVIRNLRKKQHMTDIVELGESIPIEEALSILSSSLTDHVEFEVQRVEIVYAQEYVPDAQGKINIETYEMKVTPWWRFTLHNPNDTMTYLCYVEAGTGAFRYYRTDMNMELPK